MEDNGVYSNTFTISVADSGDCTGTAKGIPAPVAGQEYLFATLTNTTASRGGSELVKDQGSFAAYALSGSTVPPVMSVAYPGTCVVRATSSQSTTQSVFDMSNSLDAELLNITGPRWPQRYRARLAGTLHISGGWHGYI